MTSVDIKVGEARMQERQIAPQLPSFDGPHRRGDLDALCGDFSGDLECPVGPRLEDIPARDIEGRERPFRLVVPEQLLDPGLVDARTRQKERRRR
jgi:hypothetical protein